ncbi:MAG: radical SAM protein [Planctomycetota bacterium]|jgi:SynChlorMet cassette radical SAM/SPASM protein ScmF
MAEAPPLRQIYYNPVGTCNLRCRHCWVDPDVDRGDNDPFAQRERRGDELAPAQLYGILDDAKTLGLRHVKFTGGEPFLRRDTIEVMEGTAERKLGLTVETNATLLDDETIARLAKIRPNQVAVSMDSADAAYHDRFRGVKGAHARALDAVRKLVAAGCKLQIIAAITLENLEAAQDMIALGRRLGVGSVKLCPVAPIGRGAAIHERGGTLSAREFLDLYRRHCNPTGPGMKVHVEVPAAFRPIRTLKAMSLCRIKNLLGLLPNGDVSYCGIGMSHPELVMGSLLRDDIGSLWREHPRLLDIREGLPNGLEGVCSRCIMKAVCLGVCRVHAHVRTGNLFAANWFCEEAEREGFFPRSRLAEAEAARYVGGVAGEG